jgi:hypothetical protein
VVVGRARLEVGEGRPDGSGVAEAVDESERGGAFGWRAGDGVCDPGVGLFYLLGVAFSLSGLVLSSGGLTVPFMAKMKTIRNREKYLAPLFSANMKMKQPVSTMGTGYMKNQKRLPTLSLASEWRRDQMTMNTYGGAASRRFVTLFG